MALCVCGEKSTGVKERPFSLTGSSALAAMSYRMIHARHYYQFKPA
jgi:hypothetical protein